MKTFKASLAIAAIFFSLNTYAATFDFIGYADNNLTDDNGTSYSEKSYDPFTATEDGITLTATGTYGNAKAFAYLDEDNAGLGLCKENLASCGSDDNVGDGETLTLTFDTTVSLGDTFFRNKSHGTSFSGFIQLYVDGVLANDQLWLTGNIDLSAYMGNIFSFVNLSEDAGTDDFYISSMSVTAVPVPAAAFLFTPAFLGLMGLRRKAAKV